MKTIIIMITIIITIIMIIITIVHMLAVRLELGTFECRSASC